MNLSQYFDHWRITENPFRGEEARHDSVFARMEGAGAIPGGHPPPAAAHTTKHSDFEKILGEPDRPASAIVFGEKGSGKTAIRLQLEERIAAWNASRPGGRSLLVAYDDLNPVLDRFYARATGGRTGQGKASRDDALGRLRQVDHLDAILSLIVPRMVDAILADRADDRPLDLGPEPRKSARKLDLATRRDILVLQALYDRAESADVRTRRLRTALRLARPAWVAALDFLALWGWLLPLVFLAWAVFIQGAGATLNVWTISFTVLVLAWLGVFLKRIAWDRLLNLGLARRVRRQLRVTARTDISLARSLRQLDPALRDPALLPATDSDEVRYALLQRLRRVLGQFGYQSIIVVIDRVDEPTLISGDPERMKAVVWPMLNNKFLQQQGVAFKMLLPIELRHALFKESAAFFQEARLDKQNLVERLSWTGAMLYDLCDARLRACRPADAAPISMLDLFAEDVTRQDLVDALDQMHQPRDAFKFLYHCLTEHCSNVTSEQEQWRVPRLVLETVRKQQSDRVQQLYRGIRPA